MEQIYQAFQKAADVTVTDEYNPQSWDDTKQTPFQWAADIDGL